MGGGTCAARHEVEDGAKGGRYLVGGREIRAGHEPLPEACVCTPIELRTRIKIGRGLEGRDRSVGRGGSPRLFAPPFRCAL